MVLFSIDSLCYWVYFKAVSIQSVRGSVYKRTQTPVKETFVWHKLSLKDDVCIMSSMAFPLKINWRDWNQSGLTRRLLVVAGDEVGEESDRDFLMCSRSLLWESWDDIAASCYSHCMQLYCGPRPVLQKQKKCFMMMRKRFYHPPTVRSWSGFILH